MEDMEDVLFEDMADGHVLKQGFMLFYTCLFGSKAKHNLLGKRPQTAIVRAQ